MEGLPLLPGYSFRDPTKTKHHISHAFDFINGYRIPKTNPNIVGPGKYPKDVDSIGHFSATPSVRYDPSLTYGRVQNYPFKQFLPHYAQYRGKSLCFRAYFKQSIHESPDEHYRVRKVNIVYFLEDDTISVIEPSVNNAGFAQGKLVRRSKIPKDIGGQYYHWKDFDVGIDVSFYSTVYHIVDSDIFTREFMQSNGIDMGPPEEMPEDPYIKKRSEKLPLTTMKTPTVDDKLRRFLEYDGKILRFYAIWEDDSELGEKRELIIRYYLADDCVEVGEVHKKNDGRDPFPLLLHKTKVPKNWKEVPLTYPSIYRELTEEEVEEFYSPKDFLVGDTVFLFARRLFIYDCDPFTRNYYRECLNIEQKPKIQVTFPTPTLPQHPHPPHTGIGTTEDTIQNVLRVIPKAPKKDVIRMLHNANKKLRYTAVLDKVHPEDEQRSFVLIYYLSNGELEIMEPPQRNSGYTFTRFLRPTHIAKPNTDRDDPEFYTPADFYIGAMITVFEHRFLITGADLAVYRYMQANPDKFPESTINNVRNYMVQQGYLREEIEDRTKLNLKAETKECLDVACCDPCTDPPPAQQEMGDYRPFGMKKFEDDCISVQNVPQHFN
ncbi:EF-hand domain-containing protein 1 [Frankliniella fusca]|uniref:EF-hand domain-containing protein 1 n=1 Tax=Frankliniella fusca TaxID=407009 RepID=A0AAE1LQP4_9NEOP|nr:EF-hand domain-containing protein 1 [Frankliniella fusca]